MFLGGAPLNAAYHLQQHGVRVRPISAVGRDFLGQEALLRLRGWGADTRFVAVRDDRPTGVVRATIDAAGKPHYLIFRSVAWDRIPVPPLLLRQPAPTAVVFGTLALREPGNRTALASLFAGWPDAWRVLDLNLRTPFDRRSAIEFALRRAQVVKLNDEELARLTDRPVGTRRGLERAVRGFAGDRQVARICVTAGSRGAGLLWEGEFFWEAGRKVQVRDTVGSGDAFLGALLASLLGRRLSPARALVRACRMGEWVATQDGPTPPYPR